jgi:hypothetical protein
MGYRLIEVGGSNPAPIQQQLLFVLLKNNWGQSE